MTPPEYESVCRLFKEINLKFNTMCLGHNLAGSPEYVSISRDLFSLGLILGDIHDREENPLPDVDRTKCYMCGGPIVFDYKGAESLPFVAEVGTFCDTQCMRAYEKETLVGIGGPPTAAVDKCECGEDADSVHVCYTLMYKDPKFRDMVESIVDERIKQVKGPAGMPPF